MYNIYDLDKELKGHLRKAPKLSYQALHPGNNKRNFPLALSIIHETSIAASKSYLPNRADVANFLTIFNTWWTISNSKHRFTSNVLGNAIVLKNIKTEFYRVLADWIEQWCDSAAFKLTAQTKSALVSTLLPQGILIDKLLVDDYQFVRTARLQSDLIERRFSQYHQMSGRTFLVSLREAINSERVLKCRSLIKADIDFWEEHLETEVEEFEISINEAFDV